MTIPDFQSIMLPLLKIISDGREYQTREIINKIADEFNLSEEDRKKLLPSGTQPIIDNRVGWAKSYMKNAGLLESPKRGYVKISDRGIGVLKQNPKRIDIQFLDQFPEFVDFRSPTQESATAEDVEDITPDELIEKGFNSVNTSLVKEIIEKIREVDPYYFEQIVGKLLTSMGYGSAKITQRSGDGGIDGEISQDKLGLDKIYFQTKRYAENNPVTARDVRDFVGTLSIKQAQKGVFITTSRFPNNTKEILGGVQKSVILIDGKALAELMIEYSVGVNSKKTYTIKEIDNDFFIE